jgi:uncharacterized protein (TIGR02246 family)
MNVRDLIERYNGAWNAQDLDTIHALHHPDIVFHNHTADEKAEGADAVREHIAAIFRNNPDLRFTTRSLSVGDDFAVCEWTARARGVEWDGVDVFPIRNGLIARKDVYSASHRPREPKD